MALRRTLQALSFSMKGDRHLDKSDDPRLLPNERTNRQIRPLDSRPLSIDGSQAFSNDRRESSHLPSSLLCIVRSTPAFFSVRCLVFLQTRPGSFRASSGPIRLRNLCNRYAKARAVWPTYTRSRTLLTSFNKP